jgi:hypothetical protein
MKNTKNTKVGRKKGSFCFASVTLAELNSKFPNGINIPVSHKWLMGNGIQAKAERAIQVVPEVKSVEKADYSVGVTIS